MLTAHPVAPHTPLKLKKIAVLTDFSPFAEAALRWAAAMARGYGAEIVLAHAYLPPACACAAPEAALAIETFEACRENLEDRLVNKAREPWLNGIHCSTALCQGGTADLLQDLQDADLIVVGTSGQTGLQRALLGSTAEMVFRSSLKPVLTVGPHCECNQEGPVRIRTILCAVDVDSGTTGSLAYALSIAARHNAQLLLLHVVEEPGITLALEQACARAEVFEKFRKLLPDSATYASTTCLVGFGDTDSAILMEARIHGADLIVLGAHKTKVPAFTSRLPGGTAYNVAANSECPVLTIPSGNGSVNGLALGVTSITESERSHE